MRARPAGFEPATFRLTTGCSEPLSYSPVWCAGGATSSGCAEQRESRESSAHCTMPRRPPALHGVAVLLFFPDHRLSNSDFVRVDALGAALFVLLHRIPMVRRETPHLAHGAGGASSYRSVPGVRERR